MSDTINRIKRVIAEHLGIKEEEVTAEKTLVNDLGADSLDAIEIAMAIEDEFNIEIPDADIEKVKTVQDIIDATERHLKR